MLNRKYKPSLLFVFCNANLANTIKNYFESKNYKIDITYNCKDALNKILTNKYKLVLLDRPKIEEDCIKLIKTIRNHDNYTPIIVFSYKQDKEIEIYRSGANLHHYKPVNLELLEVQIDQLLNNREDICKIKMLDIEINLRKREIRRDNKIIKLTKQEFDLLLILITANGHVLSKSKIISNLMDYNKYVQDGAVNTLICRTRNKLADFGRRTVIETVVGSGYKLNDIYSKNCKFT